MTTPDLFTIPPSAPDELTAVRNRLEAIESAPPCYLKFQVERTSRSEIYVRVVPGTKPKDVPQSVIEEAARQLDDSDWGFGSEHDFSGYNGKPVDADEAEAYTPEDATGLESIRAEVARLEKAAMLRLTTTASCEKSPNEP